MKNDWELGQRLTVIQVLARKLNELERDGKELELLKTMIQMAEYLDQAIKRAAKL